VIVRPASLQWVHQSNNGVSVNCGCELCHNKHMTSSVLLAVLGHSHKVRCGPIGSNGVISHTTITILSGLSVNFSVPTGDRKIEWRILWS